MQDRPDFIIIGAMKCATSTVHEQLARQAGIFMAAPKEPNFFSDDEQYRRGVDWYGGLFREAPPGSLRGESSTHYTKLPTYPSTVDRMRLHLEQVKVVYIMRHPIDRLVSQYIHEWTQRVIEVPIDKAVDQHPELTAYSRYAMQLAPYLEVFGSARVLPVFMEVLSSSPQRELERICRFLGYRGAPRWYEVVGRQNASEERLRQSSWRDILVTPVLLRRLRRAFVPQSVRDWVKGFWKINKRPQLADIQHRKLVKTFDDDLQGLSRWLGLDLTCDTWKAVVADADPRWVSTSQQCSA